MGIDPSFNTTFRPHIIPKHFTMAHYLSLLALAAFAGASPVAQGVTDAVAPSATAPAACSTDYASRFGIAVMSAATNAAAPAATVSQIADGQVQAAQSSVCYAMNSQGRTVSLCSNGSLALGGSTTFYQCRSGGFYNLYDQNIAEYCEPVTLNAVDLLSC